VLRLSCAACTLAFAALASPPDQTRRFADSIRVDGWTTTPPCQTVLRTLLG